MAAKHGQVNYSIEVLGKRQRTDRQTDTFRLLVIENPTLVDLGNTNKTLGISINGEVVIALDEMHSSAVLSLLVLFFVKSQLESVRVWRETSRHRHRRHPSWRGLALRLNVCFSSLESQEQKARASRSRASL